MNPRWRPLTSNSSEGRKQFLYHFPQLIPVFFSWTVSLIKFSVHKITILFFKSKSKYEISTHSLPRWRKLKELLDVSSSPFLLFLYARLTRNWLHFEQSSSYSRYIWSSLCASCSIPARGQGWVDYKSFVLLLLLNKGSSLLTTATA